MTDHGNLFGAVDFYEKAREAGVKPILGCETYISPGSRFDKEARERDSGGFDAISHLLLIAMDDTGYRNLMQLVSKAYLEGFYYKPRIDLDLLRKHSEGLIATSGCLSSLVSRRILGGQLDDAWRLAEEFSPHLPRPLLPRAPAPRHRGPGPRERRAAEDVGRPAAAAARHERRALPRGVRPRAPRRAALHRHRREPRRPEPLPLRRAGLLREERRRDARALPRPPAGRAQHHRDRRALRARAADGHLPHARVPGARAAARARRCSRRTPGAGCARASGSRRTSRSRRRTRPTSSASSTSSA